jgi:hypothetical protein
MLISRGEWVSIWMGKRRRYWRELEGKGGGAGWAAVSCPSDGFGGSSKGRGERRWIWKQGGGVGSFLDEK